jgi:SAM-dependent MidA family methyltransferase
LNLEAELLSVLPEGFIMEVCPAAEQWWRTAASSISCGKLVTMDYGFTEEELLAPERTQGTLRACRAHHLSHDLLAYPGEQDLTAHVNFTALQQAGERAGLRTEALASQANFLTGIAAKAWSDPASFGEWTATRTRQFQTLTHPDHLGRSHRVLIQTPILTLPTTAVRG